MDIISCSISKEKRWYHGFYHKRTWILSLIPITFVILFIAQQSPFFSETIVAMGVYKVLSQGISLLTGIVPFSLMELFLVTLPLSLVTYILFLVRKYTYKARSYRRRPRYDNYVSNKNEVLFGKYRRPNRRKNFLFPSKVHLNYYEKESSYQNKGVFYEITLQINNLLCVASILFFLFVILAGTNYYRYPLSYHMGLELKESSVEELYEVLDMLAKQASELRLQIVKEGHVDEYGSIAIQDKDLQELGKVIQEDFQALGKDYDVFSSTYGRFKGVYFSKFMSRMEITGIYWPFTVEANVNVDATDYSVLATIAHEMAHQRGFMREDEANFIAYLVGSQSDNILVRYSGLMLALSYGNNQLYGYDRDLYEKVVSNYNSFVVEDLREDYYYWVQFEDTVISTVSNTMNDTYLKANQQSDGVKSYGRMVDLLLAYHRK